MSEEQTKTPKSEFNFNKFTLQLEEFFTKQLPALPDNVKDILVKIIPIFALVEVMITLSALPVLFGLNAYVYTYGYVIEQGVVTNPTVASLILLIGVILLIIALPGLFAKTKIGWKYWYFQILWGAVASILFFNFSQLIGTFVSLYIAFQIKKLYK